MRKNKYLFCFIILCMVYFSCKPKGEQKNDKTIKKDSDIENLLSYALAYKPANFGLDTDINDSLRYFDLEKIFISGSEDTLLLISEIFILKHYLYEIKTFNQGYNLLAMRNGETKFFIDYALLANGFDTVDSKNSYTGNHFTLSKRNEECHFLINEILDSIREELYQQERR